MNKQEAMVNELVTLLCGLQPIELLGLAKRLKVPIVTDQLDAKNRPIARDAMDIVIDCIEAFSACNRSERRLLLKILRAANHTKLT